jgi:cytochrome c-type biogenesis protein CcmH
MIASLFMLTAVVSEPPLADPAAEARAQVLMREIRCIACENEPISQSSADMAADMRAVVREQIAAGQTDAEIRDWFAKRYGEFVLFRPRASAGHGFVWIFPFGLLILAGGLLTLSLARRNKSTSSVTQAPLEEGEREALKRLRDGNNA